MREELELKGLFNSLAENRTPRGRCYSMQNADVDEGIIQLGPRYSQLGARSGAHAGDVGWGFGYGKFGCNETQRLTITGTPTGGTVILAWTDPDAVADTTAAIAYNATAGDVYDALQAMDNIEAGDITVTGGPWPTWPIDVTFKGRFTRTNVNAITLNTNSLTGGTTPTLTVDERVQGGIQEEYLAVVQLNGETTARVYSVNPDTGTYTELATGLTASNWFFVQYRDKVYACNSTDGLTYKQLGGDWAGSLGVPAFGNPTEAPNGNATFTSTIAVQAGSAGSYSGWSVDPTVSLQSNVVTNLLKITLNASLVNQEVSFTWTMTNAQDWSRDDVYLLSITNNVADNEIDADSLYVTFENIDGSPLTIEPAQMAPGRFSETTNSNKSERVFHFGQANRADRDNIKKINFTMFVRKGTSAKIFYLNLEKRKVWVNDRMATLNIENPTKGNLEYAYTWYDVSAESESRLSPIKQVSLSGPIDRVTGVWVALTAPGNATLTTSDYVKFYRKDRFGQWRFIGQAANVLSGNTTTIYDKNMHDDLDLLDAFGIIQLPGGFNPETVGVWKQSLVVISDLKLWLSAVGRPLVFAYDPEDPSAPNPDENDPDRARTLFLSDNRAEDGYGIIGQDSLYPGSPYSSYALVGDKPADLSPPRRLPGSRGAVGYRAMLAFGGGVEVPSHDGLFYYSVGRGFSGEDNGAMLEREETIDVRKSWQETLLGSSYSGLCTVEDKKEIWVFNGAKYMRFTRNEHWVEGTFADSVLHAISTREHGLVFMDSKGRVHTVSDDYTTDNGTAATWSYTTGILDGPPIQIDSFEIQCEGRPRVTVTVYDGNNTPTDTYPIDLPQDGQIHRFPIMIQPGYRFQFSFSGGASDKVLCVAVHFHQVDQRKGN